MTPPSLTRTMHAETDDSTTSFARSLPSTTSVGPPSRSMPLPSSPLSLLPQQSTRPSSKRAQANPPPTRISTAGAGSATFFGASVKPPSIVGSLRRSPLCPQHQTSPRASIAHVDARPAESPRKHDGPGGSPG
jgi:hypothetical protein